MSNKRIQCDNNTFLKIRFKKTKRPSRPSIYASSPSHSSVERLREAYSQDEVKKLWKYAEEVASGVREYKPFDREEIVTSVLKEKVDKLVREPCETRRLQRKFERLCVKTAKICPSFGSEDSQDSALVKINIYCFSKKIINNAADKSLDDYFSTSHTPIGSLEKESNTKQTYSEREQVLTLINNANSLEQYIDTKVKELKKGKELLDQDQDKLDTKIYRSK